VSSERGGAAFLAWKLKALVLNRSPTYNARCNKILASVWLIMLHQTGLKKAVGLTDIACKRWPL